MLLYPKKRTIGSKTSNYMFLSYAEHIDINSYTMCARLRRSKRQRKKTSFGDDLYSWEGSTSAPDATHWDKAIKTKIESIKKNNT